MKARRYYYTMLVAFIAVALALCWRTGSSSTVTRPAILLRHLERHILLQDLCRRSKKTLEHIPDAKGCFYDDDNKVLGHMQYLRNTFSKQPYVSNGYIGARISTPGHGFSYDEIDLHSSSQQPLTNGWPLFNNRYTGAFVAGFFSSQERLPGTNFPELYANGYDSVIASLPYWAQLDIMLEDKNGQQHVFNPQHVEPVDVSHYNQNMSLQNGVVHTSLIWLNKLEIDIEVFVHKRIDSLALMTLAVRSLDDEVIIKVKDSLDFATSQRSHLEDFGFDSDGIYMVVQPENVPESKAAVYSTLELINTTKLVTEETVTNEKHFRISPDRFTYMRKYVAIVSTEQPDRKKESELEEAKRIAKLARVLGMDALYRSHSEEWGQYFEQTDIVFPSDPLLTLAGRASLFHVLSNTNKNAKGLTSAIGATGLSSDSYGGMVFWDTDIWIVPGILPFAPDIAKAISNYRNYTLDQARRNAQQYGLEGAAYPWTSGRFGNCTSSGPCVDYEYHVNFDIALSSYLLWLGGESEEYLRYTAWPLLRDAADFLSQYTKWDPELKLYTTNNLTDPDEFANHINNGAFTNAGIDRLLLVAMLIADHLGEVKNPRWDQVNGNIYIPKSSSGITLEYSGMDAGVNIKQADVVMLTSPLSYHNQSQTQQAIDDLFYYSLKQADIGPAMTFPIFAIASRRLFSYGCSSQSYLQKSVLPYIRAPFGQFSEQADDNFDTNGGTHPAFPFLTAHGGFLLAVVHGILGIRFTARVDPETKSLIRYMSFDPVNPLSLPGGASVKGLRYMGQRLDIDLKSDHASIVHQGDSPVLVEVNLRNSKAGNYTLNPGEKLVVPTFDPPLNIPGSNTECKRIANLTSGLPAEVPLSAIDGNNYTFWQPFDREPARLLIDMGSPKVLTDVLVLWGSRPAKYLSLYVAEDAGTQFVDMVVGERREFVKLIDKMEIEISEPFNPEETLEVKLYPNNETCFEINSTIRARYIVVEVEGAMDEGGEGGATINEIALF